MAGAGEAGRWQQAGSQGIVEGPGEGVCRWITLDRATHSHRLIL